MRLIVPYNMLERYELVISHKDLLQGINADCKARLRSTKVFGSYIRYLNTVSQSHAGCEDFGSIVCIIHDAYMSSKSTGDPIKPDTKNWFTNEL